MFTDKPSRSGWATAPATPSFTWVSLPQPARTASAIAHTAATIGLRRRRAIGFGSLAPRRSRRIEPGGLSEARRLGRLPARDRDPLERLCGRLLEDHPQPLERLGRVAPYPPAREVLLDGLDRVGRFAKQAQLHPCEPPGLGHELVYRR